MTNSISFKTIFLEENRGHGVARRKSLEECSNELVALMDADDISLPHRFSEQLKLFLKNDKLDVCGGYITEFIDDETNIIGRRKVELDDDSIKNDLRKRCPMNQVSVMLKKSSYEKAGGYIDWYCEEDYYLWARMVQNGCVFENVNVDLVNVRTGLGMSARRGGWDYFKSERKMQKYLRLNNIISWPRYLYNVALRFGGEVLAPNWLRKKMFKFMRSRFVRGSNSFLPLDANIKIPSFSVAMCVYAKDNAEWFNKSLESVSLNQTLKPSEIVLVIDGPIPDDIRNIIEKYANLFKSKV